MLQAKDPRKMREEIQRWVTDPFYWACKTLGESFDPWSGQRELWDAYRRVLNAKVKRYEINEAIRQGLLEPPVEAHLTVEEMELANKIGISVMSGHGLGKEKSITAIALHFFVVMQVYKPIVICTAPAGPTLFNTMWREFTNAIRGSEFITSQVEKLANKIYLKEDPDKGDLIRIVPRTIQQNSSPEQQGEVLAGMHSLAVMYCITEASGVPEPVFKPIEGGLTDPIAMVLMIFNPTKRTGTAAESHTKYRKNWVCLQWDARKLKAEKLDNPGRFSWFNERAQDVLIEKYGEDSDTVRIRVIGLPAKQASDTLIHYDAVVAAQERDILITDDDPLSIGVDVGGGGSGGDPSVIAVLRGPKLVEMYEYGEVDEFELADIVAQLLGQERANLSQIASYCAVVDYRGVGRSTYKVLEKQGLANLYKVDVGEGPVRDSEFHRMRDEVWWELREAFMESKEIVIENDPELRQKLQGLDELISELTTIKWASVTLNGRTLTKVQGKGSSSGIPDVKPLLHSPDHADALALAWRGYLRYCSKVPHRFRQTSRWGSYRTTASWKTM